MIVDLSPVLVASMIELLAIKEFCGLLLLPPVVLHGKFLRLEFMHLGNKLLTSGEILDALVGFFFFLHEFDYPCLNLRLLLLDLF